MNDWPLVQRIDEADRVLGADRNYLQHDDRGAEREPFYLLQVADWAGEHGLSYLANYSLGLDWMSLAPASARKALDGLPRTEALQYLNCIYNTPFRCSFS